MSAGGAPITIARNEDSKDEDVCAFLPPGTTATDPKRGAGQPALPQPSDDQELGMRPTMTAGTNVAFPPYRLECVGNAILMTAVSSNEVRVSLPIHEDRDGEPSSRPVTRTHGIGIADTPISAARNADCRFSEDVDTTVLEDMQIEVPPSIPESVSNTPRMLEDATFRVGSTKMEFNLGAIGVENSPFPEVRASVSNTDDPTTYAMTIRMWFVGLFLCSVVSAINVFFSFRDPAPDIAPIVLVLISHPMGKFLAFSLPMTSYRIPLPYLPPSYIPPTLPTPLARLIRPITLPHALEFSLNPGPWNIKEHVLVSMMTNVAIGIPYAIYAIATSQMYYGLSMDYWIQLVLVLATQLMGFGLAGLCRTFLISPASMLWPENLVLCTLLNTLHEKDVEVAQTIASGAEENCGGVGLLRRWSKRPMTRYRFFIIVFVGSFLFFFLPGYLFQALSMFSFICWAAPNNVVVNQLFGVSSGLGMSFLTFDWNQISWIGSPLMYPWWAQLQIFIGFVLFVWILTPVLYYTNSWYMSYFPISGRVPYDRFGQVYNITRILTSDYRFDPVAYNEYSPIFLPATFAITYLVAFALCPCIIIHTLLNHSQTLLGVLKGDVEADDIHAKLMREYPEAPNWWYLTLFCISFALAVVAVEVGDTRTQVWSLALSVALPAIYIFPGGFLYATTGLDIPLNFPAEIIAGLLLPGNAVANMMFKTYSTQTLDQAFSFLQDLKLGHYIKVPPRATFLAQLTATILMGFVQIGVKQWMFAHVKDICSPTQSSFLTCPDNQVIFTASVIWGLIGPSRQFGAGTIYHPQLYALIIGTFLPLPFWLWKWRYPQSRVRWVSTPLILYGMLFIPPVTGINYSSWFLVGFVFQYLIQKRNFTWWSKFNYVTSAAMDSGTLISVLFIFFTLQLPKGGSIAVNWWGNNVFKNTVDWSGQAAFKPIPPGGIPVNF